MRAAGYFPELHAMRGVRGAGKLLSADADVVDLKPAAESAAAKRG